MLKVEAKGRAGGQQWASEIAQELNEKNVNLIRAIVKTVEPDRVQQHLQETRDILAAGGMKTNDGTRDRTPGGIFFYQVRGSCSLDEQRTIWPEHLRYRNKPIKIARMAWGEAVRYSTAVASNVESNTKGGVEMLQVKLAGRPLKAAKTQSCMVVAMKGTPPTPSLPNGLPTIPDEHEQIFAVYIGFAQWKKIADPIKKKTNVLRIHGYPIFNAAKGMTVVLAETVECVAKGHRTAKEKANG